MAITEAQRPKRMTPMVHDLSMDHPIIPIHQKHLATMYEDNIPAYAIDRDSIKRLRRRNWRVSPPLALPISS